MLTPAETQTLVKQLKFIFEQFVDSDQHAIVHAVLRMSMESIEAVLELQESLFDAGDDASCGPPPVDQASEPVSEAHPPCCGNSRW